MITLLEAPRAARRGFASLDDEQQNNEMSADDDDDEEEEIDGWSGDEEDELEPIEPNCVDRCLAVGQAPDETAFSDKWKREFSKRPTWFNADMALHQILRGRAIGFRWPLYSRILIQRSLFGIGCFVQRHAWLIIVLVLSLFTFFCCGLRYVYIETDIVKLWVSEGGRLNEELNFLSTLQQESRQRRQNATKRHNDEDEPTNAAYEQRHFLPEDLDERLFEIPEDEAPISSYQVLIQTADHSTPSRNVLTKKELLRHVQLMLEITQLSVHKFGLNWTLDDICFKPGALDISPDSMAYVLKPTLERLIPCIWISPIDCFFEGAKPLGPSPPIDMHNIPLGPLLQLMVDDIPDQVSWTNLDPEHVVSQVTATFDLGTMRNFFMRSGIGKGYLERLCIDPLDPACPPTAPNHYGGTVLCDAIRHFEQRIVGFGQMTNRTIEDILAPYKSVDGTNNAGEQKKKQNTSPFDILQAFFGAADSGAGADKSGQSSNATANNTSSMCAVHKTAFMRWLSHNLETFGDQFPAHLLPRFPNYGQVMRHGCRGVASSVMKWPARMILGGLHNDDQHHHRHDHGTASKFAEDRSATDETIRAEALQSVILVASPTEVFRRFKDSAKFAAGNESDNTTRWSPLVAKEVISAWARAFTDSLYNHAFNRRAGHTYIEQSARVVHPLASTSISDMLAEFCDFNYAIILAGYLLMLLYALYSQCRFDGCCSLGVESAVGLALAGVFTVTMASIAGLGLATWLGINFNAATTQIVPFLALGIGVDNMFLLLHNYPQVVGNVARNELGFLMRETGMSILTTSFNNIFAFWAGTILPIPALRSFCGQTAILLTTNLFGIFFIYPAFIALDLKRRKAGRRDLEFLCYYCLCVDDDDNVDAETAHKIRRSDCQKGVVHKLMAETADDDHKPDKKRVPAEPRFGTTAEEEDGTEPEDEHHPHHGQQKPYFARRSFKPMVIGRTAPSAVKYVQQPNGHPTGDGTVIVQMPGSHKARHRRPAQKQYKIYTLHGFLHIVYIPLLRRRAVKFAILVTMVALFALGIYGLSRSTIGLELSDVLPDNTAPAAFLKTRDKFFSFYPMAVVIRGANVDFAAQQHQIDLLRRDIGLSPFVVKLPDGEPSERYWLQLFRDWLRGMQQRLDVAKQDGLLDNFDGDGTTPTTATTNSSSTSAAATTPKAKHHSPDLQIAYSLACSYGQNYDCARAGTVRLIDESGTINTEGFYNYLYGWHEYEQMFYAVSQASFYPRLRKLRQGPPGPMKYRYFIPPAPKPLFSRIPFYCDGLRDTPTIMRMIREIRAISENYSRAGLPNYPEGVAFTFWEQYLHLDYYLVLAIGIISVSVFCVISTIIFNPWAAALVTCVVASMTVELAGFMGLAGVKLNPISSVTLITAVGIGVEFTAHVALAFLTSLGTREERMVQCLQHMFVPVIHGGMSTLLGIIMLAFSDFDFVVQYFFVVLTALVIIGLFNGLAVLPVLLAYVGPPCEIKPISGRRNRLPFPSSARELRERHRSATEVVTTQDNNNIAN
ncbi:hypothetical protein niasHS_013847 [Heterodera schachtii]|uniref:SSD domain-containing protein n=1 Tax=Heterodera schachtii TaxID=97005 RepID=A0ABD2ISA2_HETSC